MNVKIRKRGSIIILDIEGRILDTDSLELQDIVREQVLAANGTEARLLLNLKNACIERGLHALVSARTTAEQDGGQLALILTDGAENFLAQTKLLSLFPGFQSEVEAIDSFR